MIIKIRKDKRMYIINRNPRGRVSETQGKRVNRNQGYHRKIIWRSPYESIGNGILVKTEGEIFIWEGNYL